MFRSNPYQLYEMAHAALAPARAVSDATYFLFRSPWNPLAYTTFGKNVSAGAVLFERMTRRYGKPTFGLNEIKIDGAVHPVLEDVVWQHRGLRVAPKTVNQKRYVDSIRSSTITFGVGPAGTGKTFLAVAMAAAALARHEVNRIILTRPAVEAGERLGFLPGDLMAKVDPYLRPLFDALHDMLDPEKVSQYLERGVIEIAPLAFMRGRTLNDSFVILDEAQNTTPEQMKMFLTRLGFGSRMVVTGDVTQVDLPREQQSGLIVVGEVLSAIEGIEFLRFGSEDVVRHKLVQRIVEAYDEHSQREAPDRSEIVQLAADRRRA